MMSTNVTLKMRKEFLYDIVLIQKVCRMWLAKRRTDDLRLIRFSDNAIGGEMYGTTCEGAQH